ncbi:LOW QUALITY PROTEIN: testis-specific gene 10 protein [Podargus strigoides]
MSKKFSSIQGVTSNPEVLKILRECEELESMLKKYEHRVAEIQGNLKVLTAKRDKIVDLYEHAQEEISRLHQEVIKCSRTPKSTVTLQAMLRHVEIERDTALSDFRRMTMERDSLREQLKISQDTAFNEKAHLEQKIEELERTIQNLDSQRLEQMSQVELMKGTTDSLEAEVKRLARRALDSKTELSRWKADVSLSLLNEKTEHLSETRQSLVKKKYEMQLTQEKIMLLDEKNWLKEKVLSANKYTFDSFNISNAKHPFSFIIGRCRTLHFPLLNLMMFLSAPFLQPLRVPLEGSTTPISHPSKFCIIGKIPKGTLCSIIQIIDEDAICQQLIYESYRRQCQRPAFDKVDNIRCSLLIQQASHVIIEEKIISDFKILISELEHSKEKSAEALCICEKDITSLQQQLQETNRELAQTKKNRESLAQENDRLKKQLSNIKQENQVLYKKLAKYRNDLDDLKLKAQDLNIDIGRLKGALKSKERENCKLLENYHKAYEQGESWEAICHQAQADFSSVRLALISAESENRRLEEKIESFEAQMEQLQKNCQSSHSEIELLRKQLGNERASMKNLESLLVSSHEKEFQSQIAKQEKDSEFQFLMEQLSLAENKLALQSQDFTELRNRAAQLESEMDITRRQLGTECFERECAVRELRCQNRTTSHRLSSTLRTSSPEHFHHRSPDWSPDWSLEGNSCFRIYNVVFIMACEDFAHHLKS